MNTMNSGKSPKTLFININPRPGWTKEKTMIDFPIGLCMVISEVHRADFEYTLLDLRVNPKTDDEVAEVAKKGQYDVVALGGLSHAYYVIKPLVAKIKETLPESLIVVGGTVVTAMPEKFLSWTKADIGVIGEGEYTMVDILRNIKESRSLEGIAGIVYKQNEKIITEKPRPPIKKLDEKERPLWELFDMEAYIESSRKYINKAFVDFSNYRAFPINSSYGCVYRCTFCSNSYYYKYNPMRSYSPFYIVNIMKNLNKMFGINYFWFWDELTFVSKKQAYPLVEALLNAKLGFKMEMTVRVGFLNGEDEDFAIKLKEIGVTTLNYAIESGSPIILKAMNKKIDIDAFIEQKKVLDKVGIRTNTCIVLGYPQETKETLEETFNVLSKTKSYPSVGFLLPAPGTVMYDYARENGFIDDEEKYLLTIGERQSMRLNMTKMTEMDFNSYLIQNLKKLRDICEIKLDDNHLIGTTVLRDKPEKNYE